MKQPCGRVNGCAVLLPVARTLEELHLPAVLHDAEAMRASLLRLRALRDAGARIFFGHAPDFWATVPQAPVALF